MPETPRPASTFAAVLFDLDGVLVDTYEAWFSLMNAAVRDLGFPPVSRERFRASWGQSTEADARDFFPGRTVAEVTRYFEANFAEHARHVGVNPHAGPVFEALRRAGRKIAVVTNSPAPVARAVLAAARLAPDALVGGTDVPRPKPAPDMVLRACERLAVAPPAAIMIGDSRFDREAAAAAGVRFVGLNLEGDVSVSTLDALLALVL
jgi:phosphoglycolate phosphatase/AHBA synthesis associated protein